MKLLCFGVSHQSAPFWVLEPLGHGPEGVAGELRDLCDRATIREVVAISTCNRTEYYAAATNSVEDARAHLIKVLVARSGLAESVLAEHGYWHLGEDAVRHLFRVASGIDSLVVGELQILGQVRTALDTAREAGTGGKAMNALFTRAIQAARRAHRETSISRGNVSVASVAVSITRRVFSDLPAKRALVVGAGETARIAATNLRDSGVGSIVIANRTAERAEALAEELGGTTAAFDNLAPAVAAADIVVCATGSQEHLVTADHARRRRGRVLLLLDLSLPRNIDPACGKHDDVFLYGLEELRQVATENRAQRQAEICGVEALLEEELGEFRQWMARAEADRVIESMRHRIESIRQQHLRRESRSSSPESRERLDRFSDSLLRSVLHDLTANLRGIDPESESGRRDLETARLLFRAGGQEREPDGRR